MTHLTLLLPLKEGQDLTEFLHRLFGGPQIRHRLGILGGFPEEKIDPLDELEDVSQGTRRIEIVIHGRLKSPLEGTYPLPACLARLKIPGSVFQTIDVLKCGIYPLQCPLGLLNPFRGEIDGASIMGGGKEIPHRLGWKLGEDIPDGTEVYVEIRGKDDPVEIREWKITEKDIHDLDATKARDLMIRCFAYAHLEEALNKKKNRVTYNDFETVRDTLVAEVKISFNQVDESFEKPTRQGLLKVLNLLVKKQLNRGASKSIINSHYRQLYAVIRQLGTS